MAKQTKKSPYASVGSHLSEDPGNEERVSPDELSYEGSSINGRADNGGEELTEPNDNPTEENGEGDNGDMSHVETMINDLSDEEAKHAHKHLSKRLGQAHK